MPTETEITDGVAVLRLDHGKANALDLELLQEVRRRLRELDDPGVRVVVLTGTGSIFSAGVDLKRLVAGGRPYVDRFVPVLDAALLDLFRFPRPLVAAINGHAIAGGMILACACDVRLMAAGEARMGVPELAVGVPFPAVALEVLRHAAGRRTEELVLSGRILSGEEALAWGLVTRLVDSEELVDAARGEAARLAAEPPEAVAHTRELLRAPALARIREAAGSAPRTVETWGSEEVLASVRAYVERTLSG